MEGYINNFASEFHEGYIIGGLNCSFVCKIIGELEKQIHVQKLASRQNLALKFRYSEKAKEFEKICHFEIIFLSHFKRR